MEEIALREKRTNEARLAYKDTKRKMDYDLDCKARKVIDSKVCQSDSKFNYDKDFSKKVSQSEELLRKELLANLVKSRSREYKAYDAQIRQAYTTKALVQQMMEKQEQKRKDELEIFLHNQKSLDFNSEGERMRKQIQDTYKAARYRSELDQQIATKKALSDDKVTKELDERYAIDLINQRQAKECSNVRSEFMEKQRRVEQDMSQIEQMRDERNRKEKDKSNQDDESVAQYEQTKIQRQGEAKSDMKSRDYAKNKVISQFIDNAESKRVSDNEMRTVWEEGGRLREEEMHEKGIELERKKKELSKHDLSFWNNSAILAKREQMRLYNELDQLSNNRDKEYSDELERRRNCDVMKKMSQRRDLQNLAYRHLEDQLAKQEKNRLHILNREPDLSMQEEMEKHIIEEERLKLIKEHAPKLLGFLPKTLIKNKSELDDLDEPTRRFFLNDDYNIGVK